jgi:hypothetical protein
MCIRIILRTIDMVSIGIFGDMTEQKYYAIKNKNPYDLVLAKVLGIYF